MLTFSQFTCETGEVEVLGLRVQTLRPFSRVDRVRPVHEALVLFGETILEAEIKRVRG